MSALGASLTRCPLYPRKRTSKSGSLMSALGQKQKSTGDYTQTGIFSAAWSFQSSQSSHSTLFISR